MWTATSRDAEGAARLRSIEAVTDADLAHLDLEELLDALLQRVRIELDADTAVVLLLSPGRDHLMAAAACGIDEEVSQGVRIPVGQGFAGRVASERRPIVLDEVSSANVHNPLLVRRGLRSMAGVPLVVGGDMLGVLHVGTLASRQFTDEDVKLLQLVADRIALAASARLSHSERNAARALQRSLLPSALPTLPGVEFAARYVPGDGTVGGDWYDVFELPSHEMCIVMGDVAGHGLGAAVTMGRLRTIVRAHALDHRDPAQLLTKVDEHIRHFEPDTFATVLCAVLDPADPCLLISTAGHPPPALTGPGRKAVVLEMHPDLPLGIEPGRSRSTRTVPLQAGDTLCFYTDGLVERRQSSLDEGFTRLEQAMTSGTAESVCANVMAELIGRDTVDDDIAILVAALVGGG